MERLILFGDISDLWVEFVFFLSPWLQKRRKMLRQLKNVSNAIGFIDIDTRYIVLVCAHEYFAIEPRFEGKNVKTRFFFYCVWWKHKKNVWRFDCLRPTTTANAQEQFFFFLVDILYFTVSVCIDKTCYFSAKCDCQQYSRLENYGCVKTK